MRRPPTRSTRTDTLFPYATLFRSDPIRPSLLANLCWRANQSAPSPGPSMFTRPLSIAALSQTAPYDTFLFRSAERPVLMAATAFVRARIDETFKAEAAAVLAELGLTGRSEERRVRKECVLTSRSRGSQYD